MKVLSLFDGMSCGRIALERAGFNVDQYYSSEIDKYAITVSRANYPEIIQMGDVVLVRQLAETGFFGHVDLLIGGSPCQGFSFAGKQLAFNDPRSLLFFEYIRILRALQKTNANIKFLLENVRMKKQFLDIISNFLGINPVFINSDLVSAQNRQRYYWANWEFGQPEDKGILLKDIIEEKTDHQFYNVEEFSNKKRKLGGINSTKNGIRPYRNDDKKSSYSEIGTIGTPENKSATITVSNIPKICGGAVRGRYVFGNSGTTRQGLEINFENKANSLTSVKKDSVCVLPAELKWRNLTPVECERLQTVPDNYTAHVSNTQRYKMLGNGWTVDVIAHILKGLKP